jgi:hypothetical protein
MLKDDMWIVVDRIDGRGDHRMRLQWLCGDFPFVSDEPNGGISLETSKGPFTVHVFDERGHAVPATTVAGADTPPRGWLSRHYGDKTAVASLVVERHVSAPATFVSILSGIDYEIAAAAGRWHILAACTVTTFMIGEELVEAIERR